MLNQKLMGKTGEDKQFIEDLFAVHLYTGNGSTQTINNGIDLAGKGGMVWIKGRSNAEDNALFDTNRGAGTYVSSNTTNGQRTENGFTSFNSNGFSLADNSDIGINNGSRTYASWTFRKAPKFFDVVTYTGNGVSGRTINHNLGIAPGMIFVKCTSDANNWAVYHTSLSAYDGLYLDYSYGSGYGSQWANTTPTASAFTVGGGLIVNGAGKTYVAYLFAHDTTTDGLIQCGSYTGNGSTTGPTVTLGWEPQYVMIKNASATQDWIVVDAMRGIPVSGGSAYLSPNMSTNEYSNIGTIASPMATGFQVNSTSPAVNTSGSTYIYMAIRRGPMRTPTDATKVFTPLTYTGNGTGSTRQTLATGMPPDMVIVRPYRSGSGVNTHLYDRLRGNGGRLVTNTTAAQASQPLWNSFTDNMQFVVGPDTEENYTGSPCFIEAFRRAPGFFDVVCYTGTGSARTVNHNLGVAPELMIVKSRIGAGLGWGVYAAPLGATDRLILEDAGGAVSNSAYWNNTSPTSTQFTVNTVSYVNQSGSTYVAYLFASCPGVSKVGSYTGNGSSQTINCGFTAGARFVLIKRTDSYGDWYVWDTARGIVAATDPHLSLNTSAAEVTTDDTIDPDSTGFIVNQVTATNVNVSGGSYIYLAIA